jgi:hypothetical protein
MTGWIVCFALLGLTIALAAGPQRLGPGDPLPELRGQFLSGGAAVLPQAAAGKPALLLLGFSYDSRHEVEEWAGKFREQFESEPRVTFFEIPMIDGMARLGKWFIESGMRRGTPKADQGHVITVYGGAAPWKQRLGFSDPKAAYLILIDGQGKVVWSYAGAVDPVAWQSLRSEVSKLLGRE